MEILAEGGALLEPGRVLIGMRNVRAYRWITLEETPVCLQISAERMPSARDELEVSIRELRADTGAPGPVLVEGTLVFGRHYPPAPRAGDFRLQSERPSRWNPERLYREGMFHGPCFQGVKSVDRSGQDGATATLEVLPRHDLFRSRPAPHFLTDPVLLDAAGQVVAFWTRENLERGFDVFPYRVAALHLYTGLLPPGRRLECRVRALGKT
ncbi:MAG: polyketide synthase dehydratase domain-containing protein [Acidobacteria bacterium]|nr:polyketide synthase dehydratase domain-containing protein [Acidobacteriota bacterium]